MAQKPGRSRPARTFTDPNLVKRITATACREKAVENLALAVGMQAGDERIVLERTAAAWSMRAVQLGRHEARLAQELQQEVLDVDHVLR
ncbi:MAG: hypothetical protein ACJ8EH_05860 [Sphingomicrobium sp.]